MEWRLASIIHKSCLLSQGLFSLPQRPAVRTVVNLSFKILGDSSTDPERIPILIFHNILSTKRDWDGIGKTILTLTRRTVISVDLRNHGDSPHTTDIKYKGMAKDILRLQKKLAIDRASLIGHGIGGMAAMYTSLMAPTKVAGLLIVDISPVSTCPHFVEFYPKVLAAMQAIDLKVFRKVKKARKAARRKLKTIVTDEVLLKSLLSNIEYSRQGTIGWKFNVDALIRNFRNLSSFPHTMRSKKFNGPALFVGGQISDYLPPDDLPGIRAMFPQAVITYVPGAGHYVQVDDPKTFLEFVISFIKTNE